MSVLAAAAGLGRRRSTAGPIYVNTATGNDGNDGLSAATAVATLAAAKARLRGPGSSILVTAAEASPLRESFVWEGAYELEIGPADGSSLWFACGGEGWTSGWSGGPVWSRTLSGYGTVTSVAVRTIAAADGLWTRLARNTTTPTTPAAGQFGQSGTTLYVRLPADASANSNTIEASKQLALFTAHGGGKLTIRKCVAAVAANQCFVAGASGMPGGNMDCYDSYGRYAGVGGFGTAYNAYLLRCYNCRGEGNYNDGFNIHAAAGVPTVVELRNCIGRWNADEGVSPHDDVILRCYDTDAIQNAYGGFTAVGNSLMECYRCTADGNQTHGHISNEGGFTVLENASVVLDACTATNNDSAGVYISTTGSVTVTGLASGTVNGNTDADVGVV